MDNLALLLSFALKSASNFHSFYYFLGKYQKGVLDIKGVKTCYECEFMFLDVYLLD